MLDLDGSKFSGSGTIVRFGLPLAALTSQDLHLTNIRARRDPPELRPQHLKATQAVTQLCQGSLQGATAYIEGMYVRIQGSRLSLTSSG